MSEMSVMLTADNSMSWPPFLIPFAGLFVLEVDSVSNFEGWWCLVHGLLSCFDLFSSRVFFGIANDSLCASKFSIPESGSPRKCGIGSNSWCKGKFGSHPYTKKNAISAVAKFSVTL